jgi:parallel beta-helix repeat protein
MSDVGGLYAASISPGTRIRYNIVHDIQHRDYGGWGIYTDQGAGDVLIEKNIVYRCGSGPLFVSNSRNITVENNIFAFGADYQIFRAGCSDPTYFEYTFRRNIVYYNQGSVVGEWIPATRNFLFDRNLYWNTSGKAIVFSGDKSFDDWRATGQDKHSIVADPLFVDPEKGDFRLKPGSPAEKIGYHQWDVSEVGPRPAASALESGRSGM